MLEIQKYISQHKDWELQLAAPPYNLKITHKGPYVCFKYSQLDSDFSEPIVCEARGLILKEPDYKVVKMAFTKFFNFGECFAATLDWPSATATEKLDGSLISYWYDEGEWHISTNSTIDAFDAPLDDKNYPTFGDLTLKTAENMGLDISKLNPDHIYTFELCTPLNRVVIKHDNFYLYHTLTRDKNTLEEIEEDIGIPKPVQYTINNGKADAYDYIAVVNKLDDTHEGIVVKDKFNNRVKIKTTEYVRLHYLMGLMTPTVENIVYLIWKNETSEFLQYFPEKKDIIDNVTKQLVAAEQKIEQIRTFVQGRPNWSTQEIYHWASELDRNYADLYTAATRGALDHYITLMKNSNRKIMDRTREVKPKVEELMKTQKWETADDAYNWALKHDSKNARAYFEIFNNNFTNYMKKLERAGATKFIEKFNISLSVKDK